MRSLQHLALQKTSIQAHVHTLSELARGRHVVEIGFKDGNSACAMLPLCLSLTSVDRRQYSLDEVRHDKRFRFVLGDSAEMDPIPCDMLFIDGDHSYDGCLSDLHRWSAVTRQIIVIHDSRLILKSESERHVAHAIYSFMSEAWKEWEVASSVGSDYGLVTLSRITL